jgi:ribonuclease P protein component
LQRITSKAQFAAVMAGQTVSRTPHFALHRVALPPLSRFSADPAPLAPLADASLPPPSGSAAPKKALFAVADCWLGVIVPKRWAKRAVTRNTIKRQIYAVSADASCQLPPAAHVVRLRSGFDRAEFISATSDKLKVAVRAELQHLFSGAKS